MPGLVPAEGFLSSGLDRQSQEGLLGGGSEQAGNPKVQFTTGNCKERCRLLYREIDFHSLWSMCDFQGAKE